MQSAKFNPAIVLILLLRTSDKTLGGDVERESVFVLRRDHFH